MLRYKIWCKKTDGAKLTAKPPALKSLPPTQAALDLNIKRAHYQAILWNNSVTGFPPSLDPCEVQKIRNIKYNIVIFSMVGTWTITNN